MALVTIAVRHQMGGGGSYDSPSGVSPMPESISYPLLSNPLCSEMSLPVLAAHCLREIDNYCRGEPYTDTYGVELLRRETVEDAQEAWVELSPGAQALCVQRAHSCCCPPDG